MSAAFGALVAAMSAVVARDDAALRTSLDETDPQSIVRQAIRHKCTGLLLDGLARSRVRTPAARDVARELKPHAQAAVLQAPAIRAQIEELVGAMGAAGVPHALLKTGARLCNDDLLASLTPIGDLDVLIPESHANDAVRALEAVGYRPESSALDGYYGALHHHLAPLVSGTRPKPVELHVALAKRWHFSVRTNWEGLEPYLEPVDGKLHAYVLNRLGTALHLVLHGSGIYRLYDTVLLAIECRRTPGLLNDLLRALEDERIQPVETQATLALAARIAGIPMRESNEVRALLNWIARREALPLSLRRRARFVDAWYGNGRKMRGASATRVRADLAAHARMIGPISATTCALGWALAGIGAVSCPARLLR